MTLTVADTAYSIAVVRADETELFTDPSGDGARLEDRNGVRRLSRDTF